MVDRFRLLTRDSFYSDNSISRHTIILEIAKHHIDDPVNSKICACMGKNMVEICSIAFYHRHNTNQFLAQVEKKSGFCCTVALHENNCCHDTDGGIMTISPDTELLGIS